MADEQTQCRQDTPFQFLLFNARLSFFEAEDDCVQRGGKLVVLTDEEQLGDLQQLQSDANEDDHWIGLLSNIDPKRNPASFTNVDGSPNTFTNNVDRGVLPWGSGEPSINNNDQTCVFMDGNGKSGLLNDESNCDNDKGYICQVSCEVDITDIPTTQPSDIPTAVPTESPTVNGEAEVETPTVDEAVVGELEKAQLIALAAVALVALLILVTLVVVYRKRKETQRKRRKSSLKYTLDKPDGTTQTVKPLETTPEEAVIPGSFHSILKSREGVPQSVNSATSTQKAVIASLHPVQRPNTFDSEVALLDAIVQANSRPTDNQSLISSDARPQTTYLDAAVMTPNGHESIFAPSRAYLENAAQKKEDKDQQVKDLFEPSEAYMRSKKNNNKSAFQSDVEV